VRQFETNYTVEPIIVEDDDGHSESSEGIVDHNPFAKVPDLKD
jgi:hypothetical protein